MGGLSWFAIPWLAATTMGLSALALESNPVFPTYPNRMPDADVTAGLVLPNAAVALLGKGGAAATLLLIFMAVTSASSAEFIAVSSIFTYDIYQTYINPRASGKRLIYMAHTSVIVYAILLASFSTGLYCMLHVSFSCCHMTTVPRRMSARTREEYRLLHSNPVLSQLCHFLSSSLHNIYQTF